MTLPLAAIDFYNVVLFIHILSAVAAWGVTFTYPIFVRMARARGVADVTYFIHVAARLGVAVIFPASLLLLASGITLVIDGPWEFGGDEQKWIDVSMTLLVVLIVLGPLFFVPQEKKILSITEGGGGAVAGDLEAKLDRYLLVGRINSLIVLVVLFLMVTKPF